MSQAIRHRRTLSTSAHITFFFVLAGLSWLLSALTAFPVFSLIALALYVYLLFILFSADRAAATLLITPIIARLSTIISLIFIQYGGFIMEMGIDGTPSTASSSYVFYAAILLLSYITFYRLLSPLVDRALPYYPVRFFSDVREYVAWAIIAGCILIVLILLAHGASTGFPLLMGMDRFVYRRYFGNALLINIIQLKPIISITLGCAAFALGKSKAVRATAVYVCVALIGIFFLYGDKFFAILGFLSFFMVPWVFFTKRSLGPIVAIITPLALVAMGLVFWMTYYIYSDGFTISAYDTFQKIAERMTGQGELWFMAVENEGAPLNWNSSMLQMNLRSFIEAEPAYYSFDNGLGTYYFSNRYSPEWLYYSLRNNEGTVSFTMGFEAITLIMFGYLGMIAPVVFAGFIFAVMTSYLAFGLKARSLPSVGCATYLLIQAIYGVEQAAPFMLFSVGKLKIYFLIFLMEVLTIFGSRLFYSKRFTEKA